MPSELISWVCLFVNANLYPLYLQLSVDARYNLEVKVLSFSNPSNTDRAGQQCDSFDQICEYIFRFCLSLRGSSDCIYGVESTTTYFITASSYTFPVNQELISGSGVPNPVVFPDAVQSTGNPWPVSKTNAFKCFIQ